MLDTKLRQLFQRWRLYEKDSIFWVIICYDIEWILKIERYFKPNERSDLYDFIFETYFMYEYRWQPLSARKIALLLWVHHSKVDDILNRAKMDMRKYIELQTKSSAKNENLSILL